MRLLPAMFLASTCVSAFPLRPGAQVGYQVERRGWVGNGYAQSGISSERLGQRTTTFTTLTVLDSASDSMIYVNGDPPSPEDSAPIWVRWRIAIRDSLIGGDSIRVDTAMLVVSGSEAFWERPSCLVGWDLHSSEDNPIFWSRDPLNWGGGWTFTQAAQWGKIPFGCSPFHIAYPGPPDFSDFNNYWLNSAGNQRTISVFEGSFSVPLPRGIWACDTGWLRYHDTLTGEEWRLWTLDGSPVAHDSIALPASILNLHFGNGSKWIWEKAETRGVYIGSESQSNPQRRETIEWKLLDVLPDSSGWTRLMISQTISDNFGVPSEVVGMIRLDLLHDQLGADQGLIQELAWGSVWPWFGRAVSDSIRVTSYSRSSFNGMSPPSCFSATRFHRKGVGLDSLSTSVCSGTTPASIAMHDFAWYRLLSYNGTELRSSHVASRPTSNAHLHPIGNRAQLVAALRGYPGSRAWLSDVSGRSWALEVSGVDGALERLHGVYLVRFDAPGISIRTRIVLP